MIENKLQHLIKPMLLTDYASCGKKWDDKNALMTVWMNAKA